MQTPLLEQVFNFAISFMTPFINSLLQTALTGLVSWEHNTSDDETATRLMYGVFQTQVRYLGLEGLPPFGNIITVWPVVYTHRLCVWHLMWNSIDYYIFVQGGM